MQTSIIIMIILSCSLVDAKSMDIDSVISWYQPSDVSAAIKEPPSEQSSTTKASKTTTTSTTTSTQTPSRFEAIELLKQLKETHPDLFQEFSETKPEETPQNEYKEEIVPLARQMPMKMPMQAPSYYQQQQQHVQPPFFPFPSWPQFAASFPQMHPSPKRKNLNYANVMNQNQNFNNNEEDEETTNLNGYMGGASYPNRNYMPSFGQMPPLPPPMMAMMMKQMQRMMMNPFKFLADSGMNMPSPFYNSNNNYDQSQNQQLSQHEQVIPNALEIVRDLLDTVIRGKEESNSDGKDSFLRDFF